jgi:mono/diheme cytochrome c family protein
MSPSPLKLVGASPLGGNERLTVPLDMAIRGDSVAVVAAGNRPLSGGSDRRSTVWLGDRTKLSIPISLDKNAMPIAVAATQDRFVVQTIGRSSLWLVSDSQPSEEIMLDSRPQNIRGVELFYASDPSIGLACASCHPDGKDDGHKWQLKISPTDRFHSRTLSLLGTLEDRTVFRRTGTFPSLLALVKSDLASLSPGKPVEDADSASLTAWLLALKAPWVMAPASDATQIAHGKALFEASCASCHGTDKPTSHKVSLSKGEPELVSPLLTDLNNRAPYLHDGCATTLDMVFDGTCPLAGDVHRLPNSNTVERSRLQALRAYLTRR